MGCIAFFGQSVLYHCSDDLASVTVYNASENCSGVAFGGLMPANTSAAMKAANNGDCVADLFPYTSARVISGSLCAPVPSYEILTDGISAGAIAGISGGSAVVAATIVFAVMSARKRFKKAQVLPPKSAS